MSQENVERTYRAFDAINRRDLDAYLALMDDDLEAVPRVGFMEGSFRGHDGIRRWWRSLLDVFPDFTVEVGEVRDFGDVMVAALHVRGTGLGSDVPAEDRLWCAVRERQGKCVWWGNFDTEAEALASVGLSAQDAHAD
jgi:ketosteroid isomerase-like protein